MAVQLVVLVSSNARRDMVEHRRRNYSFCIRQCATGLRSPGRWHCVGEGDEDQGEGDETPAIVSYIIKLEIVGCEVGLRGWAEPANNHDGVVNTAQAAEGVPECSAVRIGVENLECVSSMPLDSPYCVLGILTVELTVGMLRGTIRILLENAISIHKSRVLCN
jgi:hypothetical protein